jgi:hypothetical protein
MTKRFSSCSYFEILHGFPSYPADLFDLNDSITSFISISVIGVNLVSSISSFLLSCKSLTSSFVFELSVNIWPAAAMKYLLKASAIS